MPLPLSSEGVPGRLRGNFTIKKKSKAGVTSYGPYGATIIPTANTIVETRTGPMLLDTDTIFFPAGTPIAMNDVICRVETQQFFTVQSVQEFPGETQVAAKREGPPVAGNK